ncbi:YhdP family protein [Pseudomonas abieticivorans]|uniref:YhdP family protein n=1 Tax=Pseudomonas abieticivorans TaxID=2931382 RepID=UPI0020C0DEDA|nr:YhdP family protein [Pseudomonas sp. PIA16]
MERLTRFLAALTRWGLGLCALLLVLVALYVSLGRQLVPLVDQYRADVEAKASDALGMPLSIGQLEGRWSGLAPILLAHDVMIGEGASALRLDQVRLVPDLWASLKQRQVRIAHLELSGLQLSVEEGEDGKWTLKGLPVQTDAPADPEQILKRLQQVAKLSVLDSQLTLEPFDRAPLTLTYVGLSLQTGATRQRLDLRLTLPDGQPLALNLRTKLRASQWRDGQAQAYISLPQSDWSKWLPPQLTQRWKLDELKAGGEAWVDWNKGTLQSAAVRLNAPTVRGAYADRKLSTVNDLALNAWFQRNAGGYDVSVNALAMTLGKTRWETRAQVSEQDATDSTAQGWKLQADHLDLTPITGLIDAWVPLPDKVAAVVDGLKVTGGVRNVTLDYRPQAQGDQRFAFAGNLDKVGFNAYHGAPAAGSVSGAISGDLGQGELRLATNDFMLHLDPIFAKPWYYKTANARLTWKLDAQGFTLVAPYLKVLGDEGQVAGDFLIRLPFDHAVEPYMDLRVGLVNGDGRYTPKYLPAVLSPAVDEWLRTAILQGKVDEGYFQYQGSLAHDAPDHSRSISLFFKVRDAQLAFQPGWPHLTGVDGDVFIQDGGVRIEASKGQILNTQVRDVEVTVPHVPAGEHSHLYVDGNFDGTLGDGIKILQDAPIGTGPIFAGWEGAGPLGGKLKLDIPLVHGQQPKVVVDFKTADATLKLKEPALDLSKLKGDFRFDYDKGLSGQGISAQAFDRPVTAQIFAEGKPGTPLTRITAKGQIALQRLTDWLQVKQTLPASGDIPYDLQVSLGGTSQLSINSDLKGLAVDLPAPFGKAAGDSRATTFKMNLQGAEKRIDVTYADLASLAYAAPGNNLADGRGDLVLGQGAVQLPDGKGLRVRGKLDSLDLDPWKQQVDKYAGDDPGGSAKQLLNSIDLKVGQVKGFGLTLDQANLLLSRSATAWTLAVDSQQVKGTAGLPDAKGVPITVNLREVHLPPADPNAAVIENAPDPLADVDPRKIPAVDVTILKLYQGSDLIGGWSLKVRPTAKGIALNNLDLGLKGIQLQGSAGWEGAPGATNSWYKGRLEGKNLGDVLKAWGFAPNVTSEDFHLNVDGNWPGSPAWIALKRFSGSLDATLNRGQFVEVGGAQALRVFGLLNFNSIGRRLRLDFSDLFGKGLGYDQVKGLLVASNGVYVTREPITMNGPSSNFELNGTLDMVADQVDAKLRVTLPVTNNLPIAALIVGFPAVGGALFLVDKLIGDRVSRFASVQYSVKGPWKEPKITFDKPFKG